MAEGLEIRELNIRHLADVLKLQDKIIANLHEDEKHFILKRSVEDFMKALDSKNTRMIGVFDGDKLIAQSIFEFPINGQHREYEEFVKTVPNNDLVIYKATIVDVDYRGRGLMQDILAYREKKAREAGKTTAISQIAIDNPASWINALKNGMSIRKVAKDPCDKAQVLYLQKDFYDKQGVVWDNIHPLYIGKNIHKEIPALFNKMRYLTSRGYQGIKLDKESGCIIWAQPRLQKELVITSKKRKQAFFILGARDKTIRS